MAEILPIRRKTLYNQSINQSINQSEDPWHSHLLPSVRQWNFRSTPVKEDGIGLFLSRGEPNFRGESLTWTRFPWERLMHGEVYDANCNFRWLVPYSRWTSWHLREPQLGREPGENESMGDVGLMLLHTQRGKKVHMCWFVCTSHSSIFHSYGDVTITGKRQQILTYCHWEFLSVPHPLWHGTSPRTVKLAPVAERFVEQMFNKYILPHENRG